MQKPGNTSRMLKYQRSGDGVAVTSNTQEWLETASWNERGVEAAGGGNGRLLLLLEEKRMVMRRVGGLVVGGGTYPLARRGRRWRNVTARNAHKKTETTAVYHFTRLGGGVIRQLSYNKEAYRDIHGKMLTCGKAAYADRTNNVRTNEHALVTR